MQNAIVGRMRAARSAACRFPPPRHFATVPPMPDYRRLRVAGGTTFFTVTLRDRASDLLVARVDALRAAVRQVRAQRPFHIDAWVVLPEHMHCVWTLPPDDSDYFAEWKSVKARFSRSFPWTDATPRHDGRPGERGLWQRRFWEHTIRDERDCAAHMDYVHFNPVKHGLVAHPADWPYSSFRRAVALGLYPADWGGPGSGVEGGGERA
jgi:putative transposase